MAAGATNGDGARSFTGQGFGTLRLRVPTGGDRATPPVASRRAYLRGGLPALYQDGDFGMRFVGALETLLDPIVATLDALPAHFRPDYASEDVLGLLAAWLGVELGESQTLEQKRDMVRSAADLGRRRGTVSGMQLALRLAFPDLPLRVADNGGVRWGAASTPIAPGGAEFVVYCDEPVGEEVQAAIARRIEHVKPVQATYRLRVRAPREDGS